MGKSVKQKVIELLVRMKVLNGIKRLPAYREMDKVESIFRIGERLLFVGPMIEVLVYVFTRSN